MVKVIYNYELKQTIGQGNFGLVYRATNKKRSGNFAIKVIPFQKCQQNDKLKSYIDNQIETLSSLESSEYIIHYYQVIKSEHSYYIVYEYCDGGTIEDLLKKEHCLSESQALIVFYSLVEAFKVLNKNNIMHRDLKPENIFIKNDSGKRKIKLGDFGFCKGLKPDQNLAKSMLGSPIYMAPEVLKGESYTTKADIWSLGVILYEMIFGNCPFTSNSIANLISTIDSKPIDFPPNTKISEKTKQLIKKMLTKDYFRRIGWVELFNYKINQNGQYITNKKQEQNLAKKIIGSLFQSHPASNHIPVSLSLNCKSQSYIHDDLEKKNQIKDIHQTISNKTIDINEFAKRNTSFDRPSSSQPKQKHKFMSEKFMKIFSSPLSLGNNYINKAKKKYEDEENENSFLQNQDNKNILHNFSPSSKNTDIISQDERAKKIESAHVKPWMKTSIAKYVEQFDGEVDYDSPKYKKYRKQCIENNNSQYIDKNLTNKSVHKIDDKRQKLLKKHENIEKMLNKILNGLELSWKTYRNEDNKREQDVNLLKKYLEDAYILLNFVKQKLKEITQSIKITETNLLDMASLINYEQIQVDKFLIQMRNQLLQVNYEETHSLLNLNCRINKNQNGVLNFDVLGNADLRQYAYQYFLQ